MQCGRTQLSALQTEPSIITEVHNPMLAPVGVQVTDVLVRSMPDLAVTDMSSCRTAHRDPNLSQPIVEVLVMPMCTPPVISKTSVVAVEQLSPSDKVLIRRCLQVSKDGPLDT